MDAPKAQAAGKPRLGWAFFKERNFTVDSRTLGLFRVAFGLHLLIDLYDRVGGIDLVAFFSNDGVLPNHYALYKPQAPGLWGLLFGFSSPDEVRFAMFFLALVFTLYTLGLFTRVMQVLALVCIESLNWRFILTQHGGTVTTNVLAVWSVFLPLGDRLSLDSLIRTMRSHPQADAVSLKARAWREKLARNYTGLAFFGFCLNWAGIYFFNAYHKQGGPWHDGTAVHYTLWLNRMATHFAAWLRMHEPFWFSPMSTWGALVMEFSLPLLILTPVFQKWAHRVAFLFIWALHGTIALLLTLGPFSYSMMVFAFILLTKDDWALLSSKLHRKKLERTVRYDPKNPLHAFTARMLARLDALDHLTFVERGGAFEVKRDSEEGRGGLSGLARVAQALPLGQLYAWVFAVPFLNEVVYSLLKLTARFVLERPKQTLEEKEPGVLHRRLGWLVENSLAALVLVAVLSQFSMESWGMPARFKITSRPQVLTAIIDYLQIPQGWSMFAPDPPQDDALLVVDAVMTDGSHLDPLTGQPPDFDAPLHGPWFMDQEWCEMHARMRRWPEHWRNFRDYIFRIPKLQNWPPDKRIVSFEVFQVTSHAPLMGQTVPTQIKREKLFDSNL